MTALLAIFALAAPGTAALQSILDGYRDSQDVPGISAVIVQKDELLFSGATGVADLESSAPITPDSVFYIGSVSKVLTAVLTLRLVEDGQLLLDDDLAGLAAVATKSDPPITVRQLLAHSSGLEREGNFGYWFTADFPDERALRRYLETARLLSPPGESLHYSNIGYGVLGLVIEQVAGIAYSEALRELVLKPLKMSASGGRGPAVSPARGYTPVDRILPSRSNPFAGVGERIGHRHERAYHDARAMSPAFGAYASASDMGQFMRWLLGGRSSKVLSMEMRSRLYERQASGWGLGLKIRQLDGRTVARHDGWFAAHRTHLLLDIENGVGVVVMANSDNAEPGDIAEALLKAVLDADQISYLRECRRCSCGSLPPSTAPGKPLCEYAGLTAFR